MRLFTLLSFQHVVLYLIPTLIFIIVFGVGLGYSHFHSKSSEARKSDIHARFPEDIEGRNAPFPLVMTLLLVGTIAWILCYIIWIGILEVKI
jgi:hypothetical protein